MRSNDLFGTIRPLSSALTCGLLLMGLATAQRQQKQNGGAVAPPPREASEALDRIKQGDFFLRDVDEAEKAGPEQAMPALEKQFAATEDATTKGKIASALVGLGDKNDAYWNYLVEQASLAIGNDMPDPNNYDAQGKGIPGPSPQFIAWAKAHKLTTDAALEIYGRDFRAIAFLGESRDTRAIPFLRQALLSPDLIIEMMSTLELAQIGDKASIPLIIDACQRAPAEVARGMAIDLLRFNDPRAQAAAEQYLPKDLVQKIVAENSKNKAGSHP